MAIERKVPGEIRIFLNHVYEFKKGVRNMVLYTMNKEYEAFAIRRLERQNISYLIQEVNANQEGRKTDVRVTQQNGTCTGVVKDATDRKSTRLNSSHASKSRMPSSA